MWRLGIVWCCMCWGRGGPRDGEGIGEEDGDENATKVWLF